MRMMGFAAFAAAVIGVTASGALASQQGPDDTAVVATAVTSLLHQLRTNDGVPEGAIGYDPRSLERRTSDEPGDRAPAPFYALGERENGVAAEARAALGAQVGNLENARVCANASLRSCRLRDAVAVFATSEPAVRGNSAEVVVKALWMSNLAKQPVQEGVFRITLLREGTGWRAATTETLIIS
jgi:hypothetical protein